MGDPTRRQAAVRYDWAQVRRYWESHALVRATVDAQRDPNGLDLVCHTGAPRLVNRYYHRGQRMAFAALLDQLPAPGPTGTALDVGCGTGRWSRLLHDRGYGVTGIDVQSQLVLDNARRFPAIRFEVAAIQEFSSDHPFDLVSTVTVLQHLPHDEQDRAIAVMAALLRPGGHAVVLENTSDWRSPTVFANTLEQWSARFAHAGMELVRHRHYDYSPALRTYYAATRPVRMRWLPQRREDLPDPESADPGGVNANPRVVLKVDRALKVLGACVDSALDPVLFRAQAGLPAGHVAALFRRR